MRWCVSWLHPGVGPRVEIFFHRVNAEAFVGQLAAEYGIKKVLMEQLDE